MLQRIREYGIKQGRSEPGLKPQAIQWAVVFSENGEFSGVMELGDAGEKRNEGLVFPNCPRIDKTGSVVWSQFLWDDLATLLAWPDKPANGPRATATQTFFLERLAEAGEIWPALGFCAAALKRPDVRGQVIDELKARRAKPKQTATIQIGEWLPLRCADIIDWWRGNRRRIENLISSGKRAETGPQMTCLLSGESTAPARIHPFVQGMGDVGGNAKSAIISFNEPAFRSYGLKQSYNAAVSEQAAAEYTNGLNCLIRERSRRLISYRYLKNAGARGDAAERGKWAAEPPKAGLDAKAVLWFDRQDLNEALNSDVLMDPSPFGDADDGDTAQEEWTGLRLLEAVRRGGRPELTGAHFFSAMLSSAQARVMVRDWREGPLTHFADMVLGWFSDLEIADVRTGARAPNPPFARLLGALARKRSEVPPAGVVGLWLAAIGGGEIPSSVQAAALRRLRIEISKGEAPRTESAALLKASLLRSARRKGDGMETIQPVLREDHPNTAYQCGRLMAVLSNVQRAALGDVGAGVIQRYFTAASATPSLVFGRLLRNSQHHLEKLEPGLRDLFDGRIASIVSRIGDGYPASLNLEGQSMFALGYYQQIAEDRRLRQINKAKKEKNSNG